MVKLKQKLKASTLLETIIAFVVLGFIVFSTGYLFYQVNQSAPVSTLTRLHLKLVEEHNKNAAGEVSYLGFTIKHLYTPMNNGIVLNETVAYKNNKLIERISTYEKLNDASEEDKGL